MHLPHPFYKFPFRFDVERLRAEIDALPEEAWLWHVQGFAGNSHLPLISTHGESNNRVEPPMRPTEYLKRSPYIQQVFAQFKTLHGRARLMRLEPGHGVPSHVDMKYYWRTRTRVHIPVITHPDIRFHCGGATVHMAEGEAWTFDNWRMHEVVNDTGTRRIHLTLDTLGGSEFWSLARPAGEAVEEPALVPFRPEQTVELQYESYIGGPVMPPGEVALELGRLASDVAANPQNDPQEVARLRAFIASVCHEWDVLWYGQGPVPEAVARFRGLMQQAHGAAQAIPPTLTFASNGRPVLEGMTSVFAAMVKDPQAPGEPDRARGEAVTQAT